MVEDKYVNSSALPWKEFGAGVDFKLLRTSQETGTWTVLFAAQRVPLLPLTGTLGEVNT